MLEREGADEKAIEGAKLILGAAVMSTQVKLAFSRTTHESNSLSPTSPTANLIVFHFVELVYGSPYAVSVSVNPSASMVG